MSDKWMYFILFALGGALLYSWGLNKSLRREQELMQLLCEKGWRVLHRALRSKEKLSLREIQMLLAGIKVKPFGSRHGCQVIQPAIFTETLLKQLMARGKIQEIKKEHTLLYKLNTK